MWQDPVVKETRKLREQYQADCGDSTDAIFADIIKRQKGSRKHLVKRPPRPVSAFRKLA
jgi:hypothetical protein